MTINGTVLIVDNNKDILTAGRLLLKRHFSKIVTNEAPENIPKLMADHHFDAILL